MSKIMPWIDELPEAAKTDFPARRDEIVALLDEAAELVRKAEELSAEKMGKLMPAGMPGMPPGMKFPF